MLTEQGSLIKSKKFLKWKISFFFFSNKLRKNYLRGQPIALIRTGNRKDKALGKGKLLSSIKKPYVHFFFFSCRESQPNSWMLICEQDRAPATRRVGMKPLQLADRGGILLASSDSLGLGNKKQGK